jgi:hypothetical protein
MFNRLKSIILLLTGLTFLTVACKKEKSEKPKNLLDAATMTQILTDVHLLEAKITGLNLGNVDTSMFLYKHLEKDIFKKYQIDTTTYRASYKYYLQNLDEYEAIYGDVVKNLDKKIKADSLAEAKRAKQKLVNPQVPPATMDSINKVNREAAKKSALASKKALIRVNKGNLFKQLKDQQNKK